MRPTGLRPHSGHEQLDDSGLIHMNGRIYDPELGRMLSPDPFVQVPEYSQNFNRYSYVLNNPLNVTDPSGYSVNWLNPISVHKAAYHWGRENWRTVVVIVVVAVLTYFTAGAASAWGAGLYASATGTTAAAAGSAAASAAATFGNALAGAYIGAVSGGLSAALAGGDLGDVLRGAVIGGISGALTGGMHSIEGTAALDAANIVGHGVIGGASNVAMGGKFGDGFVSAAASAATAVSGLTNPRTSRLNFAGRTALAATVGGTVCAIGGGKFANGAVTGAFHHLVNAEAVCTGFRWLLPNHGGSKQMRLITEQDSMGKDLLEFPEVKNALKAMDAMEGPGPIKWRRSLANEGKMDYVKSFGWDLLVNRTRALVGSIRGNVYRDSDNYVHVTAVDALGLTSATHLPPSNGSYGASLLKNDLFGWNGVGGTVYLNFDVKIYRPYDGRGGASYNHN